LPRRLLVRLVFAAHLDGVIASEHALPGSVVFLACLGEREVVDGSDGVDFFLAAEPVLVAPVTAARVGHLQEQAAAVRMLDDFLRPAYRPPSPSAC
jgi:hypothetical protein